MHKALDNSREIPDCNLALYEVTISLQGLLEGSGIIVFGVSLISLINIILIRGAVLIPEADYQMYCYLPLIIQQQTKLINIKGTYNKQDNTV